MKTKFKVLILFAFLLSGLFRISAQEKTVQVPGNLISKLKGENLKSVVSKKDLIDGTPSGVLSSHRQLPRTGDQVVKLQASYLKPGDPGQGVVWNFNNLRLNGGEYEVNYRLTPYSSLTGIDNSGMQSYAVSGDSLLVKRYENPLSLICLERPEEIMVFPTSYGDERTNHFYGKGKYCDRLEMDIAGFTYSIADGYGTLVLPVDDTLKNVLRVYTAKITMTDARPITPDFNIFAPRETPLSYKDVLIRLEQDTAYTLTETYRWYVEGTRYPVLETGTSQTLANGKVLASAENTYVFHPLDQETELPKDTANLALKDKKDKDSERPQSTGNEQIKIDADLAIKTYPNPVQKELNISIQSGQSEEVQVQVYNLQGQLIQREAFTAGSGAHTERIDMSRLMKGSYILQIQAGDKSEKKVIVKQ